MGSAYPSFTSAIHPGVWLKTNIVEPQHIDLTVLAKHFGVSRPALTALLDGRHELSAKMAIGIEKAFGLDAAVLCQMQMNYNLLQARQHAAEIKVASFTVESLPGN